jgi:hypothetical protein
MAAEVPSRQGMRLERQGRTNLPIFLTPGSLGSTQPWEGLKHKNGSMSDLSSETLIHGVRAE